MASAMPDSGARASRNNIKHHTRDEESGDDPSSSGSSLPSLLHKGQLVIQNEGSVTRDYLAYERNYLAWVKLVTSCLVISGGLIIRLHVHEDSSVSSGQTPLENKIAMPMGIIFFVLSVLALISATLSFFQIQKDLIKNVGHVSTGRFTQLVSLLATAVIATACVLLMIATT